MRSLSRSRRVAHTRLHSFPTRRSSDLERAVKPKRLLIVAVAAMLGLMLGVFAVLVRGFLRPAVQTADALEQRTGDRKSTRLNSSHVAISYAVFCLKKQTTSRAETHQPA